MVKSGLLQYHLPILGLIIISELLNLA